METYPSEQVRPPVVRSLQEKIVAFHDKHIKATSLSEHAVNRFEAIQKHVRSEKGKALVEKLQPKITEYAKAVEVSGAAVDLAAGVVSLGFSAKDIISGVRTPRHGMDSDVLSATGDKLKEGLKKGAIGGIFLFGRPVTRLADIALLPIAERVGLWVDGILLRKEQRLKNHQMLVGSSYASS